MGKKFGHWPLLSLLMIMGALLFNKFRIADHDLKAFKADRSVQEAAPVQNPVFVMPEANTTKDNPEKELKPIIPDRLVEQLPVVYSQTQTDTPVMDTGTTDPETPPPAEDSGGGIWKFIMNNLGGLILALMGFIEAIVRLTPSEKDNSVVNFLKFIIDKIFPNKSAGGGTH